MRCQYGLVGGHKQCSHEAGLSQVCTHEEAGLSQVCNHADALCCFEELGVPLRFKRLCK